MYLLFGCRRMWDAQTATSVLLPFQLFPASGKIQISLPSLCQIKSSKMS
uniref:Uncharacterized protein n=1 Tax=Mesocestoides corti TaxID=53468 RepID=A0A5K3FS72_MESCO